MTQHASKPDAPEQPVRGTFHWVPMGDSGQGVMYQIYEQDGVEIMEPVYWRVEGEG